jgi:hypothetical protein
MDKDPGLRSKQGYSIARRAQIIGAMTGVLLTIGAFGLAKITSPHEAGGDIPMLLLYLVLLMPAFIFRIFGIQLHLSVEPGSGGSSGQWDILSLSLTVVANAILCLILGWIIGKLIHRQKSAGSVSSE